MDPMQDPAFSLDGEARAMRRRLLAHIRAGGSTDLGAATLRVDPRVYTDPQRFEAERHALFGSLPMLAGLGCDIPAAGDVLLHDGGGPGVIVVRQRTGAVRAFLNLCRHRGARLLDACGRLERIDCPFHNWRYDLDGRLLGIPVGAAFADIERAQHGLVEVPAVEWQGLVFVVARAGAPAIDIEAFLGPLAPLLAALDFAGAVPVAHDRIEVEANWKLVHDTFCEPYHVPALHPQTLAPALVPWVALHDRFGLHQRYASPGAEMRELADLPEQDLPEPYYQGVHLLYPNVTFTAGRLLGIGDRVPFIAFFRIFPGASVGQAVALAAMYRPRGVPASADEHLRAAHASILHVVQAEDFVVARRSWRELQHAPADFRLVFGRNEMLLQQNHRQIADTIGMPLA